MHEYGPRGCCCKVWAGVGGRYSRGQGKARAGVETGHTRVGRASEKKTKASPHMGLRELGITELRRDAHTGKRRETKERVPQNCLEDPIPPTTFSRVGLRELGITELGGQRRAHRKEARD